eukprot:TRINITY_DN2074_c0_g1_i5.p1 TRINITY_DN2074_c0_g1~~TRINITY_DN2074_c0_g1_i5.p1  ORF type:complete len:337 (+),score=32.47 TRINITY_DN2074_c0_g1_i5:966-1976(+)
MELPLPIAARVGPSARAGSGASQALATRVTSVSLRRALTGHFGKLYDLSWGSDSTTLMTAAQDGKIILWNALRKLKRRVFSLESKWTLCCDLSPSMSLCAAGGLDNTVSVFPTNLNAELSGAGDPKPSLLREHDGYLSSMTFISDTRLVTSSGDCSIILWDLTKSMSVFRIKGHDSDVMTCVPCPSATDVLASGSCDSSVRIWDVRHSTSECVVNFQRHESDVNRVKWVPDSQYAILTGSDDNTCRLHDIRSSKSELAVYSDERVINAVTSVDFSRSGKLLFVGYDDGAVRVWDTMSCTIQTDFLAAEKRVTALEVSPDGFALATADWEGTVHLWA